MSESSAWLGLAAGAAFATVVACAAAPMPSAGAPPPVAASATPMPGDPHAEIQRLSGEIAAERDKLGMPAPEVQEPTAGDCKPTCMIEQMSVAPSAQDNTCHPAATTTCHDVCNLADSICADATKICDLARQLATDAWAAGKCSEAQKSCTDAHGRCCGCGA